MRWCFLAAALIALAAAALGCSSSGAAAVEGKVSYGGEPIDVGTITFIPKSEGIKTGGIIDNGAYNIEAKLGPPPGSHRVEIRWARPTGKTSKNEFGEEIKMRQEGLPEKYHDQSMLTAEIKPGKNVIDFALEK
jgi:hypothetical protein